MSGGLRTIDTNQERSRTINELVVEAVWQMHVVVTSFDLMTLSQNHTVKSAHDHSIGPAHKLPPWGVANAQKIQLLKTVKESAFGTALVGVHSWRRVGRNKGFSQLRYSEAEFLFL